MPKQTKRQVKRKRARNEDETESEGELEVEINQTSKSLNKAKKTVTNEELTNVRIEINESPVKYPQSASSILANSSIFDDKNVDRNKSKSKLCFKNPNFSSKFRNKEKNSRISRNLKNLMNDNLDSQTYNQCNRLFIFRPRNRGRSFFSS